MMGPKPHAGWCVRAAAQPAPDRGYSAVVTVLKRGTPTKNTFVLSSL